jgi:hypothetical protein
MTTLFSRATESARRRGEIAIGYRLFAESGDSEHAYSVHINPRKSEQVTFTPQERIIVLAEE